MKFRKTTAFALLFFVLALPGVVLSQTPEFKPLVGIPGIPTTNATFGDYMNALYALAISLAGLLAVVKIVIAGAKYMLSDIVTSKEDAKKDIKGALFGLLIVLAAALILYVINPQLAQNNIILSEIKVDTGKTTVSPPSTVSIGDTAPANFARDYPSLAESFSAGCSALDGGTIHTYSDGSMKCLGAGEDPTPAPSVNTDAVIDDYISSAGLSGTEATTVREQYQDFITPQEPLEVDIEAVTAAAEAAGGGSVEILYVVNDPPRDRAGELIPRFTGAEGSPSAGDYKSQYLPVCDRLTDGGKIGESIVVNGQRICYKLK